MSAMDLRAAHGACLLRIYAKPKPAVDDNGLASDEIGGRGREKSRRSRDILGCSPAIAERLAHGALLPGGTGLLAPRRFDPTRRQAVDTNLRGQCLGQTSSKGHHGPLHGAEHFAAVTGHALFGLIPA